MASLHPIKASVLYSMMLCVLIGCQSQDAKVSQVQKAVHAIPAKEEEQYVNPTLVFYPLMKDVPCSFTLNKSQLHDFTRHFYSGSLTKWFTFDATTTDTLVNIDIKLRAAYSFIDGFNNSAYYRNGFNYNNPIFSLKAITNPDSLAEISAPMLTNEACKRLFNIPDSVYLFYTFDHYSPEPLARKRLFINHLFYNHHRSNYTLMSLDTMGQFMDSITVCTFKDTASTYDFTFAIPSALQVIRHTIVRKPDYCFKEEYNEIKRIYSAPDGRFYDWTDTIISPEKHCQPIPHDSVFTMHGYQEMRQNAIPLPLSMETSLKRSLIDAYNATTRDLFTIAEPALNLFFLVSAIQYKESAPVIVLGSGEDTFLATFDKNGRVSDAREMSKVEITNSESSFENCFGKLGPQLTMYLLIEYGSMDTLDEWKVERSKIITSSRNQPLLTVPYGNLDPYFPFKDEKQFDDDKIGQRFSERGSFPDTIFKCIDEVVKLNGGYLPIGNYSITHASNGLTYWTFLQEGGISWSLNMMILDQHNILRRGTFELASGGGDEGDYWSSQGYFINDSTYYQTGKSCSYEFSCDSSVQVFRISSDGKIAVIPGESEYFRVPYR